MELLCILGTKHFFVIYYSVYLSRLIQYTQTQQSVPVYSLLLTVMQPKAALTCLHVDMGSVPSFIDSLERRQSRTGAKTDTHIDTAGDNRTAG